MANYFSVTIISKKINQKKASEIFQQITNTNRIRSFAFSEDGELIFNSRNLPDLDQLINSFEFNESDCDKIEIKDEFGHKYQLNDFEEEEEEELKTDKKSNLYSGGFDF